MSELQHPAEIAKGIQFGVMGLLLVRNQYFVTLMESAKYEGCWRAVISIGCISHWGFQKIHKFCPP